MCLEEWEPSGPWDALAHSLLVYSIRSPHPHLQALLHIPDGTFLFTSPALTQTLQLPPASSLLSPAFHPPLQETHDHPNSKIYPQFQ